MNRFESFFREMYGDRFEEMFDPPMSFAEALHDLPEFLRTEKEKELASWLIAFERKRIARLEYSKRNGRTGTTEALKAKMKRKKLSRRLRDKAIVARVLEVGFSNLNREEREELAAARRRSKAKSLRRENKAKSESRAE